MSKTIKPKSAWTRNSFFNGITAKIQCGKCNNLWQTKVPYTNHICIPCPNCGAMNEQWLYDEEELAEMKKKKEEAYKETEEYKLSTLGTITRRDELCQEQGKRIQDYSNLTHKSYKNKFRDILLSIFITSIFWLCIIIFN